MRGSVGIGRSRSAAGSWQAQAPAPAPRGHRRTPARAPVGRSPPHWRFTRQSTRKPRPAVSVSAAGGQPVAPGGTISSSTSKNPETISSSWNSLIRSARRTSAAVHTGSSRSVSIRILVDVEKAPCRDHVRVVLAARDPDPGHPGRPVLRRVRLPQARRKLSYAPGLSLRITIRTSSCPTSLRVLGTRTNITLLGLPQGDRHDGRVDPDPSRRDRARTRYRRRSPATCLVASRRSPTPGGMSSTSHNIATLALESTAPPAGLSQAASGQHGPARPLKSPKFAPCQKAGRPRRTSGRLHPW